MMRQLLSQDFLPTENRRSRTGCLPLLVICLPASASGHCHSRDAKDDGFWCDLNTALSYPPLPAQLPGREFCTIPMNRSTVAAKNTRFYILYSLTQALPQISLPV